MRGPKALKVTLLWITNISPSEQTVPELRLIVTREMAGELWDLERLMKTFELEVDAREYAFIPTGSSSCRMTQSRLPTASSLVASRSGFNDKLICVYCDRDHTSSFCPTVADIAKKKVATQGRSMLVCLKRHHTQ